SVQRLCAWNATSFGEQNTFKQRHKLNRQVEIDSDLDCDGLPVAAYVDNFLADLLQDRAYPFKRLGIASHVQNQRSGLCGRQTARDGRLQQVGASSRHPFGKAT